MVVGYSRVAGFTEDNSMITLLPQGGVQLSSNAEPTARSGWIAIRRSASQPNLIPTMHMMNTLESGSTGDGGKGFVA